MRRVRRILIAVPAILFGCAAYVYLTIPDVRPLRTTNPPSTAFMELRAREARAHGEKPRRVQKWISYARISPQLVRAVLVTEDSKFWRHAGLDYEQIKESMEVNLERGEFARGASTITQQLAKNLYLSPSKNPMRKLKELLITRRLEVELPKQRILEIYLNVIEWGNGAWGAEAAARRYFRKSAADLTPSEAALLAGAIANPNIMNPAQPTARLRRRQQMILRRMGAVTPPPALPGPPVPPPPLPDATPGLPEPNVPPPDAGAPSAAPGLPGTVVAPPKPPGKPGGPGGPGQ